MYILGALTGPSRDSWLPVGGKNAENVMTWALNGVESTLGTSPSIGFRTTLESLGPNSRQTGLAERACRSPIRLTDASANSMAVFNESALRLEDCNDSNGGPSRILSTIGKSQDELYEDVGIHSPGA